MSAIKMSYSQANEAANSMRSEANQMEDALNAAANEIISCVESSWGGKSGAAVKDEIEGLQKTFVSFKDAVYNYAKFIDDSVAAYQKADEDAAAAAANLTSGFTGTAPTSSTSVFTATGENQ